MPPILLRNHLHPDTSAQPLLLVDGTRVSCPDPELLDLIGEFVDDGDGGLIAAARSTTGFGYIDGCGRWVVPPTLQDTRTFAEDGLARFQAGELWGYVDLRGKVVIDAQFEDARAFRRGRAPVRNGKYWHYIDTRGALAFDGIFTRAEVFSPCGLAAARPSGAARYGYIDAAGNWAIPPQFSHAQEFTRDGVAAVEIKDDRAGVIDMQGQWIVKPTYTDIRRFIGGYAYCRIDRYPEYIHEFYIDTSGRVVIPAQRDLAKWMADGWVRAGDSDSDYVGLDGELATSARIGWGTHFTGHGFAIAGAYVRHAGGPFDGDLDWGILGTDGQFHPAPEGALEPLVDDDADIVLPEPGTPLAPFVTRNEDVAFLDREGRIAYRLQRQSTGDGERAVLRDAQGVDLWTGATHPSLVRLQPFFGADPDSFLRAGVDCDSLPALANTLLQGAHENLARLASGAPLGDDEDEDDEEDEDADCGGNGDWGEDSGMARHFTFEDDEVEALADCARTGQRLFRVYLKEDVWGTYQFLSDLRFGQMETMYARLAAVLTARLGEPVALPDHARKTYDIDGLVWPVMSGSSRYWIGISMYCDTGDGTWWSNIWLHCTPDSEALQAAAALAPARADDNDDDEDEDEDESRPLTRDEWVAQVGGYAGWLELVCDHSMYLRDVPAAFLDDAMVDAAIEANTRAYDDAPDAFHTPARLEALIRKGPHVAAQIPHACMTAEGLALARSLYVDELDWNYADLRRSSLPDEPLDAFCLEDVWGGLVDADLALRAVRAGVGLGDIPRWLRSDAVIEVALDNEILDVRWLDRTQFTPAIAARAVQHTYTDLLPYIPRELVTPELCLTAVTTSGTSLEYVPTEFMTVPLCVAAVRSSDDALDFVPDALRDAVLASLDDDA